MKARDLVGKTVAKVNQTRWTLEMGAHVPHWSLTSIEFTDGSVLYINVNETDAGEYTVSANLVKGNK